MTGKWEKDELVLIPRRGAGSLGKYATQGVYKSEGYGKGQDKVAK